MGQAEEASESSRCILAPSARAVGTEVRRASAGYGFKGGADQMQPQTSNDVDKYQLLLRNASRTGAVYTHNEPDER